MCADSASFLAERKLGAVERRIRLGGKLSVEGAGELGAELCLTATGVFLVAAEDRFVGKAVDLGEKGQCSYETGKLRDRLRVQGVVLTLPPGRAQAVRRCLALGRLRHAAGGKLRLKIAEDRYAEALDAVAGEFVASLLGQAEELIAVCELGVEHEVVSALGATVPDSMRLLLTANQVSLIWLSELGDTHVRILDAPLSVLTEGGNSQLVCGGERWRLATRKAALFVELSELTRLSPSDRLLEAARRLWLSSGGKRAASRAPALIAAAATRGNTGASLAQVALAYELGALESATRELAALFELLRENREPATALAETCARWEVGAKATRQLSADLRKLGERAEPWALALHRALPVRLARDQPPGDELELAEHELEVGDPERARALVQKRLACLPVAEGRLLTSASENLLEDERVELYSLLVREAKSRGSADVGSLSALCLLDPLSHARLSDLANASSDEAAEQRCVRRARLALECLSPGGLSEPSPPPSDAPAEPLPEAALREQLSHPLARGSNRFAARLSELVATVPEPNLGFLRDFCEELSEARQPDAVRALRRCSRLFGVPVVRAYISHGARSVGVRAFGARDPFVLIGESHLAKEGPFSLQGRELDFALGAELAHLAYGHQRVTSSEVWAGAAGKTRGALVALGWVLPMVGELGGPRAAYLLRKLNPQSVGKAAEGAARVERWLSSARPELALGQRNEELIVAHRLVQLTADRAGLVAAAHLRAALRAVLMSRSEYRILLDLCLEHGLVKAVTDRERTHPAFSDLRTRLAALLAFYLSSDFDALALGCESDNADG